MKYRAKPVVVDAHLIVSVGKVFEVTTVQPNGSIDEEGSCHLALSNGDNVVAQPAMLARMTPAVGDYWVIQEDGYVYLNPRDVFLRKYDAIGFDKAIA